MVHDASSVQGELFVSFDLRARVALVSICVIAMADCSRTGVSFAGSNISASSQPMFRLVHRLLGSGKSQLMKWLRSYFIDVCGYTEGVHFVFLAPLNSMAAGIGCSAVYSFGEVVFENRRGNMIQPRMRSGDHVSRMSVKTSSLRWIIIDGIEAAGCELLHDLEEQLRTNSRGPFRTDATSISPSVFGDVNVLLFGDF